MARVHLLHPAAPPSPLPRCRAASTAWGSRGRRWQSRPGDAGRGEPL